MDGEKGAPRIIGIGNTISSSPGESRESARRAVKMRLETIAVHAGAELDPTGALVPPLYLSTTF